MNLLYNELNMAEDIYKRVGFSMGQYNFREALLVAKYMRHVLGYKDAKIKSNLISFCRKYDTSFNYYLHMSAIKSIIKKSKDSFINRDEIVLFYSEIELIKQKIKNFNAQKLFLGMFLIAKRNNNAFISVKHWKNIKKICKIRISNKKIYELIHFLYKSNMLEPIRKRFDYGHTLKINFSHPDSTDIFLFIKTDQELYKVMSEYQKYCGGKLGYCEVCKTEFIKSSFRQKYCEVHKKEKELEKHRRYNEKRNKK